MAAAPQQGKMNIIMLFVDDLGWADQGYRNPKFETPNIDALSKKCLNFERAYVGQPASSPSRASLLTGKEPVRLQLVRHIENRDAATGNEWNMWDGDPTLMPSLNYLPLEERTYGEALREQGYYNMFVGKWHLGGEEFWPEHQGFDYSYGVSEFGNVSSYYAPFFKFPKGADSTKATAKKGEFMTEYLTNKTVELIEGYDKEQPFLLSMSYYNVHTPNKGRVDLVARYKAKGLSDIDAQYAAQVTVVDESVGQIVAALEKSGQMDNTVIIYFSDQGGYFSNAPLRGRKDIKDTLAEGGIRVPLMIYYPGLTEKGAKCETPVQAIDIFPTMVEIASGKKCAEKQVNGVSLMPILKGGDIKKRDLHFFRAYHEQYAALIRGDWKIIKWIGAEKFQMYNLKYDIGETTDLQNVEPKLFESMKKALREWEMEAVPTYEQDYRERYKI